jgi:hypothetical protein
MDMLHVPKIVLLCVPKILICVVVYVSSGFFNSN